MATRHLTIPPFPSDIDRNHFGSWFSGFIDGEGHFCLGYKLTKGGYKCPFARFNVQLRRDDRRVLELVQSYFQFGAIHEYPCTSPNSHNSRPQSGFVVTRRDHLRSLVHHFDAHPLFAKKARDYAIWREGILMAVEVASRPQGSHGWGTGRKPSWLPAERERFIFLADELKRIRRYVPELETPRIPTLCAEILPLFDL